MMTTIRYIIDFLMLVAMAIFALGAIAGASTVMIVAGLFDKWDRAKKKESFHV